MANVGLILLAAGNSSRMGALKQLLPFGEKTLVRHAAETAVASVCFPVFIVLGSQSRQILPVLEDLPLEVLENPRWAEGMGTSIQVGVRAVLERDLDGVILMLADQPLITPEIINRLVEKLQESGQLIVASRYAGTVGVPVFFSRELFPQLLELKPEQGCKGIIHAHKEQALLIDCPEAEQDIDTRQDYNTFIGKLIESRSA